MAINPYQAPTAAPGPASPTPSGERYVDQGDRVRLLGGLLVAVALVCVAAIGSIWLQMDMLERKKLGMVDLAEVEANNSRQEVISLGGMVLYLLTVVIFLIFLYRANKNAHALSGEPLSISPGWTVGWCFVPVANLFKPYQAVREIWQRSKGAVPLPFTLWWIAYICSGVLAQVSHHMHDTDSIDSKLTADVVAIAQKVVVIVATVLALWMVRSLHEGQRRHHETGRPDLAAP